VVARAEHKAEMAGLERWNRAIPAWRKAEEDDVLVDAMRGRSSVWFRIRESAPRAR
jgi:hypothetical protein